MINNFIQLLAFSKSFIKWWLWFQAWFRGLSIITTDIELSSSTSRYHHAFLVCCLCENAISLLMQLALYSASFFFFRYIFSLVWWWMSKINQICWGWDGNETSASDLDRKYICYPAISDILFTEIFIFFQLRLMHPFDILLKRDR